ncbi:MAG: LPS export ABC transporter ATP-binding protein [Desulfuromonadia bacterium]
MTLVSTLAARRLKKSYGSRCVVKGIDLDLQTGTVIGLLGPNGAGKTTTFYMVAGLVRPDEGSVTIDGREITNLPMHRRAEIGLGYLPQEPSVFRKLTVRQNLMAILETLPIDRREMNARAEELLEEFRITHVADSMGYALSGGERRRVEIARALVTAPRFLLLDEPFAGIDPIAVADIQGVIADLRSRGIGILISDHNVRETLGVCDSACIVNEGTVLEYGTPEKIAASEAARAVYLGDSFRL